MIIWHKGDLSDARLSVSDLIAEAETDTVNIGQHVYSIADEADPFWIAHHFERRTLNGPGLEAHVQHMRSQVTQVRKDITPNSCVTPEEWAAKGLSEAEGKRMGLL